MEKLTQEYGVAEERVPEVRAALAENERKADRVHLAPPDAGRCLVVAQTAQNGYPGNLGG